jgi:hypothetical protein
MANHQRHAAKEQFWRQLIRRWQRSGQTIRDFCAAAHVSEPSFYSWRRVLSQRDRDQAKVAHRAPRRRRDKAAVAPDPLPAFLPVTVLPPPAATLEIVLGNGRVVRLGRGFDVELLRQLLPIVEERP